MSADWRSEIEMDYHANISKDNTRKNLTCNLSSDPRIHNKWIANFRKHYVDLTQEIDDLQMLLAIMDDHKRREKALESKSRNRNGCYQVMTDDK